MNGFRTLLLPFMAKMGPLSTSAEFNFTKRFPHISTPKDEGSPKIFHSALTPALQ